MEFFPNPWNPAHRPYFPADLHRTPPSSAAKPYFPADLHRAPPSSAAKPKVISIPVEYVGEDSRRAKKKLPFAPERAAVRIQRVFRGFVVRKNFRAVQALAAKVEKMERTLAAQAEAMGREAKERLRVNEMLMRLLFRLDSVRGVREFRRKVVKRVIALQERVDAIATAPAETLEAPGSIVVEGSEESAVDLEKKGEESPLSDFVEENPNSVQSESRVVTETLDSVVTAQEEEEEESPPTMEDMAAEVQNQQTLDILEETLEFGPKSEEGERKTVESPMEQILGNSGAQMEQALESGGSSAEAVGMREVMEQVVAESERLRAMVAQLCEQSANQCRLICGLADRVEHLERFVQRMQQSKKKRRAGGNLACSADKKCGQKKQ